MRLRLTIAYDGVGLRGWQSQAGGDTVQDHLEGAFARICGERVPVHGAGRTDAGVHALAQCAHVDVSREGVFNWPKALNAHLPRQIRVLRCRLAAASFHARFSAKGKIYRYRIWNGPIMPPFENGRAWHLPRPADVALMQEAAVSFLGTHDFRNFAANRGKPDEDTVRTIHDIALRRKGALITLQMRGTGFLYRMVRLMTGALVRIGEAQVPADHITTYLEDRAGKCSFAAPANGLYLVRVIY